MMITMVKNRVLVMYNAHQQRVKTRINMHGLTRDKYERWFSPPVVVDIICTLDAMTLRCTQVKFGTTRELKRYSPSQIEVVLFLLAILKRRTPSRFTARSVQNSKLIGHENV